MTDAATFFVPAPDVIVVDMWEGDLPDLGGVRACKVEPARWWLVDAGDAAHDIAERIAGRGACTPIGGGLMRARLSGPNWRDMLSISGFFDTGSPAFAAGAVARSVIHHVSVTMIVGEATDGSDHCDVYCATSYAPTLDELWRGAIKGR